MEILGIGTDIVECPRIGKMVEHHGELFLRRVYTDREVRYCQSRKHAIEHFAGLWAAKQSILRAFGPGWSRGVSWSEIEVRQDASGHPRVHVAGEAKTLAIRKGIGDILVSIAHCRTYATAHALAIGTGSTPPIA